MTRTLLDYSATLAELHIEDLRREAARERRARSALRRRRQAARRVASRAWLRVAAAE